MDVIEIEITGWDKFNPRKDYKKPWWFAFSNRFLEDPQFFEFSADEKLAWIYLLSQASQKGTGSLSIYPAHAERVSGISKKHLTSAISKLNSMGCTKSVQITNGICTESVLHTTEQNSTEQNKQDIAPANAGAVNPIAIYCEAYKAKYGHNPEIGPKQSWIISRFAKNHKAGWEKFIRGYLEMPDSWAVARSHPVELLEPKLNEIKRFLETGKVVTRKVVEHAEEMIDKAQGTHRKPRRSIAELEAEREAMLADAAAGSSESNTKAIMGSGK